VSGAPLRRLLLATDFSRHSERAANRLAHLPLATDAKVRIVHLLPDGRGELTAGMDKSLTRALRAFEALTRKALRSLGHGEVEVEGSFLEGSVDEELSALCAAQEVELLVLGRHGARTFRDQLLGTTAERIIRVAPVPVLVVTERPARNYRRPLVALDLKQTTRTALEYTVRLSPEAKTVRVVHAYEHSYELVLRQVNAPWAKVRAYRSRQLDEAQAQVKAYLQPYEGGNTRFDLLLHGGDPRRAILEVMEAERADLLGLGTSGRRGMAHLLLGSVAETVLRRATCDVLVARTPG
jgi:nucleotide-binding universal stress UspA family protein